MTQLVHTDDFLVAADTNIEAYPNAGTPYYGLIVGAAGSIIVDAGTSAVEIVTAGALKSARMVSTSSGFAVPTGDQEIRGTLLASGSADGGHLIVRCATASDDKYRASIHLGEANEVRIYRDDAGVETLLASSDKSLTAETTYVCRFSATDVPGTDGHVLLSFTVGSEAAVTVTDSNAARKRTGVPGVGGFDAAGGALKSVVAGVTVYDLTTSRNITLVRESFRHNSVRRYYVLRATRPSSHWAYYAHATRKSMLPSPTALETNELRVGAVEETRYAHTVGGGANETQIEGQLQDAYATFAAGVQNTSRSPIEGRTYDAGSGLWTTPGVVVAPPSNTPPTVSAGTDQTITLPTDVVQLTAIASDAETPLASLTYAWTEDSGPGGDFSATNIANPTFTASGDDGVYVLRITVTDGGGLTATDTMTLTVLPAPAPSLSIDHLLLINTDTQATILDPLTADYEHDLADAANISIVAIPASGPIQPGSIQFACSGATTVNRIENIAPYSILGDNPVGTHIAWTPATGAHTLVVTPFEQQNANGTAGTPLSLDFTIADTRVTTQATTRVTYGLERVKRDQALPTEGASTIKIRKGETTHVNAWVRRNPGGNVTVSVGNLPANVTATIYHARFFQVTNGSSDGGINGTGFYPDGLVPYTGAVAVTADQTNCFVIDIAAATNATAGDTAITITINGETHNRTLTVKATTIQSTPTQRSVMQIFNRHLDQRPLPAGSTAATMKTNHEALLEAHRLYLDLPMISETDSSEPPGIQFGSYADEPNHWSPPPGSGPYAQLKVAAHPRAASFYTSSWPMDSFLNPGGVNPDAPYFEVPMLFVPGATDTRITNWRAVPGVIAEGEVWWYHIAAANFTGCPAWLIDATLVDYAAPWLMGSVKLMSGGLMWTTTEWSTNPWTTAGWFNRGGELCYPGAPVGGATNSIYAALSLKAMREGLNLADLHASAKAVSASATATAVATAITSFFSFSRNPTVWQTLRSTLMDLIP